MKRYQKSLIALAAAAALIFGITPAVNAMHIGRVSPSVILHCMGCDLSPIFNYGLLLD